MSESIVVGTDGSATAKHAVAEAIRFAKALAAEVHVVSAYVARDIRIQSPSGTALPTIFDDGNVDATLAEAAASASSEHVVVVNTRGAGCTRRMRSSTLPTAWARQ